MSNYILSPASGREQSGVPQQLAHLAQADVCAGSGFLPEELENPLIPSILIYFPLCVMGGLPKQQI